MASSDGRLSLTALPEDAHEHVFAFLPLLERLTVLTRVSVRVRHRALRSVRELDVSLLGVESSVSVVGRSFALPGVVADEETVVIARDDFHKRAFTLMQAREGFVAVCTHAVPRSSLASELLLAAGAHATLAEASHAQQNGEPDVAVLRMYAVANLAAARVLEQSIHHRCLPMMLVERDAAMWPGLARIHAPAYTHTRTSWTPRTDAPAAASQNAMRICWPLAVARSAASPASASAAARMRRPTSVLSHALTHIVDKARGCVHTLRARECYLDAACLRALPASSLRHLTTLDLSCTLAHRSASACGAIADVITHAAPGLLELDVSHCIMSTRDLRTLLTRLPQLSTLVAHGCVVHGAWLHRARGGCEWLFTDDDMESGLTSHTASPHPQRSDACRLNLRRLVLTNMGHRSLHDLLAAVVRCCPNLEELEVGYHENAGPMDAQERTFLETWAPSPPPDAAPAVVPSTSMAVSAHDYDVFADAGAAQRSAEGVVWAREDDVVRLDVCVQTSFQRFGHDGAPAILSPYGSTVVNNVTDAIMASARHEHEVVYADAAFRDLVAQLQRRVKQLYGSCGGSSTLFPDGESPSQPSTLMWYEALLTLCQPAHATRLRVLRVHGGVPICSSLLVTLLQSRRASLQHVHLHGLPRDGAIYFTVADTTEGACYVAHTADPDWDVLPAAAARGIVEEHGMRWAAPH